ncbi:MAG: DUF2079 domain-containing protein [Anaerolineae bacterium]|nr:DUF2079 domain-containing protein [Anaerolineae bacterium]
MHSHENAHHSAYYAIAPSTAARITVALAVIAFIAWFGALAIARHNTWQTAGYDLGNADQALWNTAHGRPLRFTNWVGKDNWFKEPTRLGMHAEPIYFLMVPLYWIWDDVRALLLFQVVIVALGAIPAYHLARRILHSETAAVILAVAYLAHPGSHSLVTSDFHAIALASFFLLAAFDFLEQKRDVPFAIFAILAMMTKENVALAVAGMGLWTWVVQKRRRAGIILILVGLSRFLFTVFLLIPEHNIIGRSPYLSRYQDIANGTWIQHILASFLDTKAWKYYLDYLLPLAGLPLLSPLTMLPAIPDLGINLLSEAPMMRSFGRQYVATLIPIATVAAALGLRNLWQWIQDAYPKRTTAIQATSLSALAFCVLLSLYRSPLTPLHPGFHWPHMTTHQRKLVEFATLIPPDASLCTQNNLNPHFTHRETIHLVPYTFDCDYVLLDVKSYPGNNYNDIQTYVHKHVVESGTFGLVAADDGYALFKRGAPSREFPDDFYTFAHPSRVELDVQRSGRFDDVFEFLGYNVDPHPGRPPHFSLYFKALRPPAEDYFLALYLIEEPGKPTAATVYPQPTLVWYPTSHWKPGQVVKVRANTIDWGLKPGKDYAIALGWVSGSNLWDPAARLRYIAEPSDEVVPRRFQDDTLVYLASLTGTGAVTIARRHASLPRDAHPLQARLANRIDLIGFALNEDTIHIKGNSGSAIHLRLFWQVKEDVNTDYTVFVHMLNSSGQLVGQGDSPPLGNSWPTSRWRSGDLVPDYYTIPLDPALPAGEYTIAIGMYDPQTGQRVSVSGDGADLQAQRILLPITIRVKR